MTRTSCALPRRSFTRVRNPFFRITLLPTSFTLGSGYSSKYSPAASLSSAPHSLVALRSHLRRHEHGRALAAAQPSGDAVGARRRIVPLPDGVVDAAAIFSGTGRARRSRTPVFSKGHSLLSVSPARGRRHHARDWLSSHRCRRRNTDCAASCRTRRSSAHVAVPSLCLAQSLAPSSRASSALPLLPATGNRAHDGMPMGARTACAWARGRRRRKFWTRAATRTARAGAARAAIR
jgi:hypothetical protein